MKDVYERNLFSTAGGHLWQSSHLNSHCYINHAKIRLFLYLFHKNHWNRFHSVWQLLRVVWFEQKQSADQSYFRKNESDFGSYQGKHWSKENTLRPQSVITKKRCQKLLCRFFSAKKGGESPKIRQIFLPKKIAAKGRGGEGTPLASHPPHSALFLTQKQAYFGPKPLFLALFGPFLILFDAKTTFVALVGEIFQGSKWGTFSKGGGGGVPLNSARFFGQKYFRQEGVVFDTLTKREIPILKRLWHLNISTPALVPELQVSGRRVQEVSDVLVVNFKVGHRHLHSRFENLFSQY